MKILVTGSAGFIGFHVSKKLLDKGCEVVGIDNLNDYYDVALKESRNRVLKDHFPYKFYKGNIQDPEFLKNVFKENSIEKVCHLAAQAGVRYSLQNPRAYIQSNVEGFLNILEEMKNFGVQDLIYASSSSVYGNNFSIPFRVEDQTDTPLSLYAATKKCDELFAHVYHKLYGMRCTGLRFFTVYGPFGRPDMMYFKFANSIMSGNKIELYNFGKMIRDFTYIDDIVEGVIAAIEKSYEFEIFNLGNKKPVELEYFVQCLEKELGRKAFREYKELQKGDMIKTYADIEKSVKMLGFNPKIGVEIGIKEFVNWYKSYYKI